MFLNYGFECPADIDLFKVAIETLKKVVKYVQS